MKPDFALNFTDTSIALLHRTAKGWLKVGETPFDASDLEDALDYMRKTALGLAPGGFTTKLVIPASQILYTRVDTSGGDGERTAREIASALAGKTPYTADEITWDWTRGEGRSVCVAAVARETLAEAESFAITHKFNPVAFVAIPENDDYDGEPWFGETADARSFIFDGEQIERDDTPILLIDEARAAKRRAKAAREAEAARLAEEQANAAAAQEQAPVAAPDPVAPAAPATPPAPLPVQDDFFAAPGNAPVSAAAADQSSADRDIVEAAPAVPETTADFDSPAPFASPAPRADAAQVQPDPKPGPRVAITDITPISHAAAAPVTDKAPTAAAPPMVPPTAPVSPTATAASAPRINLTAGVTPAPTPQPATTQPATRRAVIADTALTESDPDEAPFAHIPENTSFPDTDEAPDLPPLPHLARRMAGLPPTGAMTPSAPLARPATPAPAQPVARTAAAPAQIADDFDDDLPPPPSAASLAAYNRSGRAAEPAAPRTGAPMESAAAVPPADEDASTAPGATTARTSGRADLAAPARTGAAPRAQVSAAAKPARGIGSLAGLITAPSIPGTRKTRAQPATPAAAPSRAASADDAARSLGQSPFAERGTQRGKPRFLGLILTAILLLCLALVAAWSSFYLSSNRNPTGEETQVAETTDVSAEDEMLADGLDPETEAPDTTPAEEVAAATPAPETALESESPPAVALLDAEDEIFLSTSDAPPPAFDALSLPGPEVGTEAPPGAPMPPPPFGTVYRFDENGLLIPTAAGLPTPGGYMLFEGKPPRVPPARSAVATAAAEAAAAAAPAAPEAPVATEADTAVAGSAGNGAGNPSLAGVAAGVAPETATPANSTTVVEAAPPETIATGPGAQPNPELADRRPRARPARAATDDDAALQPPATETEFTSLRPRARPAIIETASATARAETAAASLANEAEVQLASATVSELSASDAANPSIMTISRRPAQKPKDFSRAVEAAVAAAVRAPDPAPAPPVETASAPAPEPAPKKSNSKSAAKPDEQEEIDEPEVAAGPAPKIPTKASVAKQATFAKAINLSKVNLIGVYGTPSKRYALVRLSNGKYRKVSIGDKIDGGQVKAITQNEVRYQKGGRLVALAMPKG